MGRRETAPHGGLREAERGVQQVVAAAAGVSLLLGAIIGVGLAIDLSLRTGQALGRGTLVPAGYLCGLYSPAARPGGG